MNRVLLTVSGAVEPDIADRVARDERPEPDYLRLAKVFGADLIDYPTARRAAGWFGRLVEKIGGPNLLLAWACYRKRHQYRVIFTDGEQVGLPLAFFLKFASLGERPAHLMIGHLLSVSKKMLLLDWLHLYSHIDTFLVYSTWQKRFILDRWQIDPKRVVFTPFMVDTHFFAPGLARPGDPLSIDRTGKPIICAVGLEYRDYPTLIEAVRGQEVQLVIAAASPWSKRADSTQGQEIPPNVLVRRFSQFELRDLYAVSSMMVMPLYNVNFQAGVTAILEAMSMGLPVICSDISGQTDVIIEGETGVYVRPGDAIALRAAIQSLLNQPDVGRELGQNGQKRVFNHMSLDCYAERLNYLITAAAID